MQLGQRNGEDYEKLRRLLEEAAFSLSHEDIRGADGALSEAGVKAMRMWGGANLPELPARDARLLLDLIWDVRYRLEHPGRGCSTETLVERLEEVRRTFDEGVRKEDGEVTAEEAASLPRWDKAARTGLRERKAGGVPEA